MKADRVRRRGRGAIVVAALALSVAGCGESPDRSAGSATVSAGRAAYLAHCSACHQHDGRGLQDAFPPLAGSDWLREQPVERSIEVVLRGLSGPMIVNGVRYDAVMPAFGHLSDDVVAAILTHVYGSWGNEPRTVTAGMVRAARDGVPSP